MTTPGTVQEPAQTQDELGRLLSLITEGDTPKTQLDEFCLLVATALDGPLIALKLLAHKLQAPNEKEALAALLTLDECVERCGAAFVDELGKFRFLNELIKVISPKYFGKYTAPAVKDRILQLFYKWSVTLTHQPKVAQAYELIKKQGLVTSPPRLLEVYKQDRPQAPSDVHQATLSSLDEEKSALLSALLSSGRPEDLESANTLIRTMVRQDAERTERLSRQRTALEVVQTNSALVEDLLRGYSRGEAGAEELQLLKELTGQLDQQRPVLFRLASEPLEDTDLGSILLANDRVTDVLTSFRSAIAGDPHFSQLNTHNEAPSPLRQPIVNTPLLELPSPTFADLHTDSQADLSDFLGRGASADLISASLSMLGLSSVAETLQPQGGGDAEGRVSDPRTSVASEDDTLIALTDIPEVFVPPAVEATPVPEPVNTYSELDSLGQQLIRQTLPSDVKKIVPDVKKKVSLNEMASKPVVNPSPPPPLTEPAVVEEETHSPEHRAPSPPTVPPTSKLEILRDVYTDVPEKPVLLVDLDQVVSNFTPNLDVTVVGKKTLEEFLGWSGAKILPTPGLGCGVKIELCPVFGWTPGDGVRLAVLFAPTTVMELTFKIKSSSRIENRVVEGVGDSDQHLHVIFLVTRERQVTLNYSLTFEIRANEIISFPHSITLEYPL